MSSNGASNTQSIVLIVIQAFNTAFSVLFLFLFLYRYFNLRQYSMTSKYKDYFPYVRIVLSAAYILISITILVFNLGEAVYPASQWFNYVFQGGGGACINSIVLIMEMLVLRLQLLTQHRYTTFHIFFVIFLALISIIRFVLLVVYNSQSGSTMSQSTRIVNIVLTAIEMVIGIAQLGCWIAKKQSLPRFQDKIEININELNNSYVPSRGDFLSEKNLNRAQEDDFPYILPFVTVQKGKIRIVLQAMPRCTRTNLDNSHLEQNNHHSLYLSPLRKPLHSQRQKTRTSQFIAVTTYSIDQLKQFYILCGRFPIKKNIDFDQDNLQKTARQFQEFLEQLLAQKLWYQTIILKYLKIPINYLQTYQQLHQKNSSVNHGSDIDQTIGLKLLDDKNSIYCSILVFRHLWILDHYEFYMKIIMISTKKAYYPIKRYSQFEDLHHSLNYIIKQLGKSFKLPSLPRKQLFLWNLDSQVAKRRADLERYLRKLCNDYNFMEIPTIRTRIFQFLEVENQINFQGRFQTQFYNGLKITKGEITKALVKNDYVTYYQLRLFKDGIEVKLLSKRYSQFEDLHRQIERWMNNIETTYQFLKIPEKVYFKSEAIRHEKLKIYLEKLVEVRNIGRLYAINSFFNIHDDEMPNSLSNISFIHPQANSKKSQDSNVFSGVIELQENIVIRRESKSSVSSRQFSMILDDLGNPTYD